MKKFLHRLASKPTPQIPEPWLRALDAYFRHGRHTDKAGAVSGYALIERLRLERFNGALGY